MREEYYNFPTDTVIALRFRVGEVSLEHVQHMFDTLKKTFPTHKLIALPEDVMELEEMDVERLIDFRDYLSQVIEEKTKT